MSDEDVIGVWGKAISVKRLTASRIIAELAIIPLGLGLLFLVSGLAFPYGSPSAVAIGLGIALFVVALLMFLLPITSAKAAVESEQVKLTPRKMLYCKEGRVAKEIYLSYVKDVIVTDSSTTYLGSRSGRVRYSFGRVVVLGRNGGVLLDVEIEDPHGFARAVKRLLKTLK